MENVMVKLQSGNSKTNVNMGRGNEGDVSKSSFNPIDWFKSSSAVAKATSLTAVTFAIAGGMFGVSWLASARGGPGVEGGNGVVIGRDYRGAAVAVKPLASYKSLADELDNPQEIYRKAGYRQTWTVKPENAVIRFGDKPAVMPKAARVWEAGFRNTLQVDGKILSTAELLRLRESVVNKVLLDPRTDWNAIPAGVAKADLPHYFAKQIDDSRVEALDSLGVKNPSKELVQLTIGDAVNWCIKIKGKYDSAPTKSFAKQHDWWPNASQIIADFKLNINCSNATNLTKYLVNETEKIHASNGAPTGLKCYSVNCSTQRLGRPAEGHTVDVLVVSTREGGFSHVVYDPVCNIGGTKFDANLFMRYRSIMGPLDEASMEAYAGAYCPETHGNYAEFLGEKPKLADGRYDGGDPQKTLSFGNFYYVPKYSDGSPDDAPLLLKNEINWQTWSKWRKANISSRDSLINYINNLCIFSIKRGEHSTPPVLKVSRHN